MNIRKIVNKIVVSAKGYPDCTFKQKRRVYTCINPYSYHIVRKNTELYNSMDGIFVDGITMCWWLRWVWHIKVPRLSFDMSGIAADLFARLDNTPTENIYFIGAKQEQLEATIEQIKIAYPMLKIAGFRNGYFLTDEQRKSEIENIVRLSPSFVVVGMGSPLQEQFVLDLKDADYSGIAFTCGGFLHQTAEGINYYPKWINKYNLRAFYRLYKEKGLFKRLYNVLLEFPILLVYDSLHYKRYK